MSADEKVVKLTGQVEIDQSKTLGELKQTVSDLDKVTSSWQTVGKNADGAADKVKRVHDETRKASEEGKTFGGVMEGALLGAGVTLWEKGIELIKGIGESMLDAVEDADKFDNVFEKISLGNFANELKDGVEVIDDGSKSLAQLTTELDKAATAASHFSHEEVEEMKGRVGELANELSVQLVPAAEAFGLALKEQQGDVESAFAATKAALMDYKLTGNDANETLRDSIQLVKAFNMPLSEQADVIATVGREAKKTQGSEGELYAVLQRLAPMANTLGVSFHNLVGVTSALANAGLPARQIYAGLESVLSELMSPSDGLKQKLSDLNVVMTQSGPAWKAQRDLVAGLTADLTELNRQASEYSRAASEIGLINNEAQRRIDKYQVLADKQANGERLTRSEAAAMKQLVAEINDRNNALARLDERDGISDQKGFARLGLLDQLKARMSAATEVQKDYEEQAARAQWSANGLEQQLTSAKNTAAELAKAVGEQLPAAIQKAISSNGFDSLLEKLGSSADALQEFSGMSQVVLTAAKEDAVGVQSANAEAANALGVTEEAFKRNQQAGVQAHDSLVAKWSNIKSQLADPFSLALSEIEKKLDSTFSGERLATVEVWVAALGMTVSDIGTGAGNVFVVSLQAALEGKTSWGAIIETWILLGEARMLLGIKTAAGKLADGFWKGIDEKGQFIIQNFTFFLKKMVESGVAEAKKVITAFFEDLKNTPSTLLGLLTGNFSGASPGAAAAGSPAAMDFYQNTDPNGYGSFNLDSAHDMFDNPWRGSAPRVSEAAPAAAPTVVLQQTNHFSDVQDPETLTSQVVRRMQDMARVGLTNGRVL